MSNFAHLKKLDVAGATAWLTLDDLEGSPRICLRFAGQSNHAYFNAMLKRSGGRSRKLLKGTMDVKLLEDAQEDDRELFPLYVVTGWEGILDNKGKEVPFSKAACKELCECLPGWIFQKVRDFAATPERFLPEDEEMAPDGEELAGN